MNIRLCTETFADKKPASFENYVKYGGYKAWKEILSNKTSKFL